MDRGWIKIYRSLLDWEWFDDAETVQLFLYLLLSANYEDKKWRGIVVHRGEFIISLRSTAKLLKTTVQRLRTRLQRLEECGTISFRPTQRYTIVSIYNYDTYQDTQEGDQHTDNTLITHNQHENNTKKSVVTDYKSEGLGTSDYPNQHTTNTQKNETSKENHEKITPTKEDKKIRSKEDKEEVANATSKKRAAKNGKGESGEDLKPTDAPKAPTEASTETLEGEVDRLYHEGKKTPQSANLEPSGAGEAKSIDYEAIKSRWNEETGGALGKLVMITGRRREMVRARIRETSVEDFYTMIHNAATSSFLRGESQRGWVANFDWCIRPNNYPKVLEGNYRNIQNGSYGLDRNEEGGARDSSEGRDYTRYTDLSEYLREHPDKR